ncbi:hypothetical protein ACOMHN_030109 [Nucella lapillus]
MGEQSSGQQRVELMDLPDSLLLEMSFYLSAEDLASLAQTCSRFNCVTKDELLWKLVFQRRFKIPRSVPRRPGATSWRSEYRRLREETPAVLCEELTKHRDQVLHVSFSHNGEMFATCSKDAKILVSLEASQCRGWGLVWNSSSPSTLRFSANMKEKFNWRYSQFSQFNQTDTLLLVSGVFHGNMTTSGEIAVFDLNEFQVQCRVTNKPYDVFGCWYDNQHLFSGSLYWTGQLQSISALWLNKASQEVESEKESVMMNLYRFSNVNASSIRTVMVANVPEPGTSAPSLEDPSLRGTTLMEMDEELSITLSQNGDHLSDCGDDENRNSNYCSDVTPGCSVEGSGGENRNNICSEVKPGCSREGSGGERYGDDNDLQTDRLATEQSDAVNGGDVCQRAASASAVPAALTPDRKVSFNHTLGADRLCQSSASKAHAKNASHRSSGSGGGGGGGASVQGCAGGAPTDDPPSSPVKACYPFTYCCPDSNNSNKTQHPPSEQELEAIDTRGPSGFPCDEDDSEDSSTSSWFSPNVLSLTSSPSVESPSTEFLHSPPQRHTSQVPRMSAPVNSRGGKGEEEEETLRTQKLLIFTMGDETYTPHLVGFKRIQLKDIVGEEEAARRVGVEGEGEGGGGEGGGEGVEEEERVLLPNVEHNLQGMNLPPTTVDHTINLKGHIVGMALSPDHRYLYVNSRQWPVNYHIESVLEPPPIAQEIDIHIIDLVTLQEVGKVMTSHKAFTPNDECFFLFLDVSDLYVASGAEDRRGYLWDRHYGVHLHCFQHSDVVNSVAFRPHHQEMLVTVSDDNTIKVWRSRRHMRVLLRQQQQQQSAVVPVTHIRQT